MSKLQFDYTMELHYSQPVEQCHYTIKCMPIEDARQHILRTQIDMTPQHSWSAGPDGFGNTKLYGSLLTPHDSFRFHISGEAEILQILYEEKENADQTPVFRHSFGMNRPGAALRQYAALLNTEQIKNPYERAVFLMHRVHSDFAYCPGVTDVKTDAEKAWLTGKGVCQDFTHIFLALCHMNDIPARYVTGMIIGEGATHAWAEILYHGRWIGMDPTNDLLVAAAHLKLSHGRDASDCLVNRGIIRGGGTQTQIITVTVSEQP